MKVQAKGFLTHLRLDRSYSLLSGRDVSLALEFFKALDVRGEMALDGMSDSTEAYPPTACNNAEVHNPENAHSFTDNTLKFLGMQVSI